MASPIPCLSAATILFCTTALAEVPSVATDIAPVHSLVAQVMGDLGSPDLIVPPGASPHGYAMRPSEARALAGADLVVWVGEGLTPWLAGPVETLAGGAAVLELAEAPGSLVLEFREGAVFAGEPEAREDEHDDHDDHDNNAEHDDHAGHDHHGQDPHAWLDPRNGSVWLGLIASALSEIDPENGPAYSENARVAQAKLAETEAEIAGALAPLGGMSYVVFHDAYQYFENRFDLRPVGAITLGDAADPSAARVAEVRDAVRTNGVTCVVSQPQFNPSLVQAVTQGTDVGIAVLDPIGAELELGAGLYAQLLKEMANDLISCR